MNSTCTCVYETEREAIKEATQDAIKAAKDNDLWCFSEVALWNGNSMIIEAFPDGKIKKTMSGGWNRGGLVYMSKRVAKVYGVR